MKYLRYLLLVVLFGFVSQNVYGQDLKSHKVVYQYIKGTYYKWEEKVDTNGKLSVHVITPYDKVLSSTEVTDLYELSKSWTENPAYKRANSNVDYSSVENLPGKELLAGDENFRFRPLDATKEATTVINSSDSLDIYPYSMVGYLSSGGFRLTAWLVSPTMAFTNSHGVVGSAGSLVDPDGMALYMKAHNSASGGLTNDGVIFNIEEYYHDYLFEYDERTNPSPGYFYGTQIFNDLTCLILEEDPTLAEDTFIPVEIDLIDIDTEINNTGYPAASPIDGSSTYDQFSINFEATELYYAEETSEAYIYRHTGHNGLTGGSSGSPTYLVDETTGVRAAGIHNHGATNGFGGVKFNSYQEGILDAWFAGDNDMTGPTLTSSEVVDVAGESFLSLDIADSDIFSISYGINSAEEVGYILRDQTLIPLTEDAIFVTVYLRDAFNNLTTEVVTVAEGDYILAEAASTSFPKEMTDSDTLYVDVMASDASWTVTTDADWLHAEKMSDVLAKVYADTNFDTAMRMADVAFASGTAVDSVEFTQFGTDGDPYEPNDTFETAYEIEYGFTSLGSEIESSTDIDIYSFVGSAGDMVNVHNVEYGYDGRVYVVDSEGTVLAFEDDNSGMGGIGYGQDIDVTLPADGVYYVRYARWNNYYPDASSESELSKQNAFNMDKSLSMEEFDDNDYTLSITYLGEAPDGVDLIAQNFGLYINDTFDTSNGYADMIAGESILEAFADLENLALGTIENDFTLKYVAINADGEEFLLYEHLIDDAAPEVPFGDTARFNAPDVVIPADMPGGEYDFGLYVDSNDDIDELDETNNFSSFGWNVLVITPGGPSIGVSGVDYDLDYMAQSLGLEVTSNDEEWTVMSDSDWAMVEKTTAGDSAMVTIEANPYSFERTATLTFTATKDEETETATVTITQAGNPDATEAYMGIYNPEMVTTGDMFEVYISIDEFSETDTEVLSFEFDFTYDPEVISYDGYEVSGMLAESFAMSENLSPGMVSMSGASTSAIVEPGDMIVLRFMATADGTSALDFEKVLFNEGNPAAVVTPSEVTITHLVCGDVSLNGVVTAYDASLVLQHASGLNPLEGDAMTVADVTGNGEVTAFDAAWILQAVVGLRDLDTFNCSGAAKVALSTATSDIDFAESKLFASSDESIYSVTGSITFESLDPQTTLAFAEGWTGSFSVDGNTLSFSAAGSTALGTGEAAFEVLNNKSNVVTGAVQVNEQNIVDMDAVESLPTATELHGNYPNPFNPTTNISFEIAEAGQVNITVYDIMGKKVATLVNGYKAAGTYQISFDAAHLTSGMYFYRMQVNGKSFTRRMTLLK